MSLCAGHPLGFPPKIPHPPPRLGVIPGAAQGFLSLTHFLSHLSRFLNDLFFLLLVTGPVPLNSSPIPPV